MTAQENNAYPRKQARSAMKIKRVMRTIWQKREYQAALDLLNTLKNGDTAEAWNYRGYATRKLGRTDEGIGYYQRSIALDPTYAKVREYLGEAWLVKGRPDLAKAQLKTIATLCGQRCEEYRISRPLSTVILNPE
jgi:tetratricopeptide (TPR) repeat protein